MTAWLELSEVEGKRFGLRVARHRIDLPVPAVNDIRKAIRLLDPDVTILRLPATDRATAGALAASGLPLIHADTLIYYRCELGAGPVPASATPAGADVVRASSADAEDIHRLALAGFHAYASHYSANPLFAPELVREGYAEWAVSHALSTRPSDDAWLVRIDGRSVGFATCSHDAAHGSFEVLLNAVDPEWQGRGLYRHLLATLMDAYRSTGCRHATISTQLWNYRVQRAWCALGFVPASAYDTYHANRNAPQSAR